MKWLMLSMAVLGLWPQHSHASIIISEIAWMGSETSASDEWIELYNKGAVSESLAGWTLSDENNLNIELAGTVGAGEFYVLERTDDNSAPVAADLIYKGALSNQGATLRLVGGDGELIDEVVGGGNWSQIGGSNVTKATPQWTVDGWVTALPTPGASYLKPEVAIKSSEVNPARGSDVATVVIGQPAGKITNYLPYLGLLGLILGGLYIIQRDQKR